MKLFFTALLFIFSLVSIDAQTFSLLSTINSNSLGSNPANSVTIGTTTFFSANDNINGNELWKTDGTLAGTNLVKNINNGISSSNPVFLTNLNGILIFAATTPEYGTELWKTDGTEAGTVLLKDVWAGTAIGINTNTAYYKPIVVNNIMYFIGTDPVNGREVWRTDGTSSGTYLLKDIFPGNLSCVGLGYLTNVNNVLYFAASDNTNNSCRYQIWKSDGTTAGTVKVSANNTFISGLTNVNGVLFYVDNDGTSLWKTDGTTAGTLLVKDFTSITTTTLTESNGQLFFAANDGTNGTELWKSDGTTTGTTLVKDINVGSVSSSPTSLIKVGNTVYFTANEVSTGMELWKSDGTTSGTILVKDILPDAYNSMQPSTNLYNLNNTLYFTADDGINGIELWKSDGTNGGTNIVKDISLGYGGSSPTNLINNNGTIIFTATDGINGFELWKTDGTSVGTTLIKDIVPIANEIPETSLYSTSATNFANVNNVFYFTGYDRKYGAEPYKTNGTIATTTFIKDVNLASNPSNASNYTYVNGITFFVATNDIYGTELWKTDGTSAGTVLVKDIYPGINSSSPSNLISINGVLFFSANNGSNGFELWKSDGTTAGTLMVKDIYAGATGSNPFKFQNLNGVLIFGCTEPVYGQEVWKSDGTSTGTVLVKDINVGTSSGGFLGNDAFVANNFVYFVGYTNTTGGELWRTDGTADGTVMIKDIYPGTFSGAAYYFANLNGIVYFASNDGTNGLELWKTDGTTAGTVMVKDIYSGATGSNPNNLIVVNDILLFTATDATNGLELWRSDGTSLGTFLIKDINAGTISSNPNSLIKIGNYVYFFAADSNPTGDGVTAGLRNVWRTDGTAAGTVFVSSFEGIGSSLTASNLLYLSGSNIYAIVNTPKYGLQLWSTGTSTALPVTDLRLAASLQFGGTKIIWETKNELNVSQFIIQRSVDGTNFSEIANLVAKGSGIYYYDDNSLPNVNTVFYRLQIVDKDGRVTYSNIVAINVNNKSQGINIFPNPAQKNLSVQLVLRKADTITLQITDMLGRVLQQQTSPLAVGNVSLSINIGSLSKGVYALIIRGSESIQQKQFIKE